MKLSGAVVTFDHYTGRMAGLSITWYGHATFLLVSPGEKRIVFDPWLDGNPQAPAGAKIDKADVICVSHGHSDHTTDVVPVARATGAPVVGVYELANYFQGKGLKDVIGMGIGGTIDVKGLKISMTPAIHTSSVSENGNTIYLGEPTGFVVRLEDGRSIYFAGDTALFGDMRLIRELYAPEIAFLPIGDHFTMGPEAAARACDLLGVRQVVPMHYGTFPLLTGTPDRLKKLVDPMGVDVLVLKPGETAS
jgi:L-ascorbate metabolism protein UlaG (beta-lactamase superfamily)